MKVGEYLEIQAGCGLSPEGWKSAALGTVWAELQNPIPSLLLQTGVLHCVTVEELETSLLL